LGGQEVYRSSILAIGDLAANLIKLFPNPSNHTLQLDFADLKVLSVGVYSIDSSLVEKIESVGSETLEINVVEYAEGVYFLQLELENGEKVGMKFVRD